MTTFFYFAYGSNMLTERLKARCPSARPVSAARTSGFDIAIRKKSKDGSGKATLTPRLDRMPLKTFGVVFEIQESERELLDHVEGPGYFRDDAFAVTLGQSNQQCTTSTYIAGDRHVASGLLPFCWYRALIIAGATEHGLPQDHFADLHALPFQRDPEPNRPTRKQAIAVLKSAGFAHLLP